MTFARTGSFVVTTVRARVRNRLTMAELLHTFVWGSLDLLLRVFLSTVHAIVEDSFIFLALGASFLWIVGYRIVWAAFITLLLTGMAGLLVRRYRL